MTAADPASQLLLPAYADVDDAARLLEGVVLKTPLLPAPVLADTGGDVILKCESLQRTGSFKLRGAYNCMARIPEQQRSHGVVAYSSGNHAQGVAAAARMLGVPAWIVMPRDAPALKRERTASLGAHVVLYERTLESREEIAEGIVRERGATLIPPYDHPLVIAGQGTVGREICVDLAAQEKKPDLVLVPASGGGLAAGIALAVKERCPAATIVTVEPEGFEDHLRSFRSGRRERNARPSGSICDALLAPEPGAITFEITRQLVGAGVAVTDAEACNAIAFAFRELKLVLEPGGAVALAALLSRKIDVAGKTVVPVLSGGNVDAELFAEAIGA